MGFALTIIIPSESADVKGMNEQEEMITNGGFNMWLHAYIIFQTLKYRKYS